MSDCRKCVRFGECLVEEDCGLFVKKPMTNADRIRAMTDEELTEELYLLRLDALRLEGYEGSIETKDEILDWLKEEVDDETY